MARMPHVQSDSILQEIRGHSLRDHPLSLSPSGWSPTAADGARVVVWQVSRLSPEPLCLPRSLPLGRRWRAGVARGVSVRRGVNGPVRSPSLPPAPLLLSLPAVAGLVAFPSSPGASMEVAGPGASGGLAAGRTTIALGGSPQVTPASSPVLPRDILQLLPLLGLIGLALGIGFYAFARSGTVAIGRLATRRSPSWSSGLLPGRARWDATPHERLQDAK